jgi:hypothetical protein
MIEYSKLYSKPTLFTKFIALSFHQVWQKKKIPIDALCPLGDAEELPVSLMLSSVVFKLNAS